MDLITTRSACIVALLHILLAATTRAGEGELKLVRMPVTYKTTMLVIASRDRVGAVRFINAFEKGNDEGNGVVGVSYEWRYLEPKLNAVEQTGTGRVFAKLVSGVVEHGSFIVKCGPIRITWDHNDNKSGSVHYDPRKVAVHPVAAHYFEEKKLGEHTVKPVDLTRFLDFRDLVGNAHRAETNGPNEGRTAGSVPYGGCVLVAKDINGIATFKFDRAFERDHDENEKHYGVTYEVTFKSHDGKPNQSGNGEVYERYRDGKYDHGQLYLEAGRIRLEWSQGGKDSGWVYYDPTSIRVWLVNTADTEALVKALTVTNLLPELGKQ